MTFLREYFLFGGSTAGIGSGSSNSGEIVQTWWNILKLPRQLPSYCTWGVLGYQHSANSGLH